MRHGPHRPRRVTAPPHQTVKEDRRIYEIKDPKNRNPKGQSAKRRVAHATTARQKLTRFADNLVSPKGHSNAGGSGEAHRSVATKVATFEDVNDVDFTRQIGFVGGMHWIGGSIPSRATSSSRSRSFTTARAGGRRRYWRSKWTRGEFTFEFRIPNSEFRIPNSGSRLAAVANWLCVGMISPARFAMKKTPPPKEQLEILTRGIAKIISEKELAEKLAYDRPLRVKLGVDPTAPDLHLGHTVPLEKLRQFQELGHQAVLLIGDFTATVGDPTGRSTARPPLTRDEVLVNAKTYTDQAFKILDREKTEIVYNGDWFRKMNYEDVLRLNSRVTMQQMLQREDFKARIDEGKEVRLHELQYPIMQGWDSVEIRADVELGGTDQLFNILVGRDFQKAEGQEQQVVMVTPLLEGLDGVKKMSKSSGNYVGVSEEPNEQFAKIMSVSDELMTRYYLMLLGEGVPDGHPLEAKKQLAERIVTRYHSAAAGSEARGAWDKRGSQEADLPEIRIGEDRSVLGVAIHCFRTIKEKRSNTDVRRSIEQGAIRLNDEKLQDPKAEPAWADGDVLKLSKKRSVRLKV
ncbi:MAG: tyrosyl-tRNA synthetase [Verrucomicrobiales bacterium]|jgi:tyrosyl-tRNA synthetase